MKTSAAPRATDMVPSVAISGLTPSTVTIRPLAGPVPAPTSRAADIASGIGTLASSRIATTVLASASTEPTERSKAPETSRMVMPTTMIAVGTSPTTTAWTLARVRK